MHALNREPAVALLSICVFYVVIIGNRRVVVFIDPATINHSIVAFASKVGEEELGAVVIEIGPGRYLFPGKYFCTEVERMQRQSLVILRVCVYGISHSGGSQQGAKAQNRRDLLSKALCSH